MHQCPRCGFGLKNGFSAEDKKSRSICEACGWRGPTCFGDKWDASSPKCRGGNDPTYWDETRGHKRPQCGHYQACAAARNREVQHVQPQPMQLPTSTSVQPPRPMAPMVTSRPVTLPTLPGLPHSLPTLPGLPQQPTVVSIPQPPPALAGLPGVVSNSLLAGIKQGQVNAQQPPQQVLQRPAQPMYYPQQSQQYYPQQQYPYYQHPAPQPQQAMVAPQPANMPAYIPPNFVIPGQQVGAQLSNPESMEAQGWWSMVGWSLLRGGIKGAGLSFLNIIDNVQMGPVFKKGS